MLEPDVDFMEALVWKFENDSSLVLVEKCVRTTLCGLWDFVELEQDAMTKFI